MKKLICFISGHIPKLGKEDKALNYLPDSNGMGKALDYCERCNEVYVRKLTNNELEAVIRATIVHDEVSKANNRINQDTMEYLRRNKNKIN